MDTENSNSDVCENEKYNNFPSDIIKVNTFRKQTTSIEGQKFIQFSGVLHAFHALDPSKINFVPRNLFDNISKDQLDPRDDREQSVSRAPNMWNDDSRGLTVSVSGRTLSIFKMEPTDETEDGKRKTDVHSLMIDETNLWGHFYNFPELYEEVYSHVIRLNVCDKASAAGNGLLTRDMVAACLSYFRRTPILGDYVYIKLDLSLKFLVNIDVLQYYKYIMYLDLTSNRLTEIKVLSHLLYLQFLTVNGNNLRTVLGYKTPQWLLTEVYYRSNEVVHIRDLSSFWSITILDLSHNNICYISGLENLKYLRRLNLSFNHIRRLENLNHLRLMWLDLSHNEISSFEFSPDKGLHTLLHLEFLNIDVNNIKSLKIFSGCTRLRELHARGNRFEVLLELSLYMWMLRRLVALDLRWNPLCKMAGYKDVIMNTFPIIYQLDDVILDPVDIRTSKMDMTPDVTTFATRRLLRLLYIQQLSRVKLSPYVPPAESTDVPLVVLVGYEAVGKGTLARRITTECKTRTELAVQHTTATRHFLGHYKVVTRKNFDNMLLAGELLTYSEADGEAYGLSRDEAYVNNGKVKIVTMDLIGALMLKLRGYRPYLILAWCSDKQALNTRQEERKRARNVKECDSSCETVPECETKLETLLSGGRLIITRILDEIIQAMTSPERLETEFALDSDSSLRLDTEILQNKKVKTCTDRITSLKSTSLSSHAASNDIEDTDEEEDQRDDQINSNLQLLYKLPLDRTMYISDTVHHDLKDKDAQKKGNETKQHKPIPNPTKQTFSLEDLPRVAGADSCSKYTIKSVTFTSKDQPLTSEIHSGQKLKRQHGLWNVRKSSFTFGDELAESSLEEYHSQWVSSETHNIRDDYEDIHRNCPGMFWDTTIDSRSWSIEVKMDDNDSALMKLKKIVKDIVNDQKNLKPLHDIDFTNNGHYQMIKKKIKSVSQQIAPQQLFH